MKVQAFVLAIVFAAISIGGCADDAPTPTEAGPIRVSVRSADSFPTAAVPNSTVVFADSEGQILEEGQTDSNGQYNTQGTEELHSITVSFPTYVDSSGKPVAEIKTYYDVAPNGDYRFVADNYKTRGVLPNRRFRAMLQTYPHSTSHLLIVAVGTCNYASLGFLAEQELVFNETCLEIRDGKINAVAATFESRPEGFAPVSSSAVLGIQLASGQETTFLDFAQWTNQSQAKVSVHGAPVPFKTSVQLRRLALTGNSVIDLTGYRPELGGQVNPNDPSKIVPKYFLSNSAFERPASGSSLRHVLDFRFPFSDATNAEFGFFAKSQVLTDLSNVNISNFFLKIVPARVRADFARALEGDIRIQWSAEESAVFTSDLIPGIDAAAFRASWTVAGNTTVAWTSFAAIDVCLVDDSCSISLPRLDDTIHLKSFSSSAAEPAYFEGPVSYFIDSTADQSYLAFVRNGYGLWGNASASYELPDTSLRWFKTEEKVALPAKKTPRVKHTASAEKAKN